MCRAERETSAEIGPIGLRDELASEHARNDLALLGRDWRLKGLRFGELG